MKLGDKGYTPFYKEECTVYKIEGYIGEEIYHVGFNFDEDGCPERSIALNEDGSYFSEVGTLPIWTPSEKGELHTVGDLIARALRKS